MLDGGTDSPMERREALRLIAAIPALPWFLAARKPEIRGPRNLPPRTVGLRSLGGAFRFDPPGLRIAAGETVTWLNIGDFHTVTSFHPTHDDLVSAPIRLRMPEDAQPFHSGMLGLTAGSVFEHEFTIEGVYDYFCQPHYGFGMVGRIMVGPGDVPENLYGDDDELPEAARQELPGVRSITGASGRSWEWASRVNGLLLMRTRNADPIPAVDTLIREVQGDDALQDAIGTERVRGFADRLQSLADALREEAGYERLVGLADDAKAALDPANLDR